MHYLWPIVAVCGVFSAVYFLRSHPHKKRIVNYADRLKNIETASELMRAEFLGDCKAEREKAKEARWRLDLTMAEEAAAYRSLLNKLNGIPERRKLDVYFGNTNRTDAELNAAWEHFLRDQY